LAYDTDLAAVELDELAAQGESQPSAFRLLLRRPDLPEFLEHRLLVLGRDPDGRPARSRISIKGMSLIRDSRWVPDA